MAVQQIPLVGAQFLTGLVQTALAASKLHLFVSGYVPTPGETLADLTAVEATFSGYTAGGYALATFGAPTLNPGGGSITVSPQVYPQFVTPMGTPVTNIVAGWYLVDATGNLVADGLFDATIAMTAPGDGFPITVALVQGTTNVLVQCWVFGSQQ